MRRLRGVWAQGECAFNGWMSLPCAFSAELMARAGWDCLTVDMQHGLADYAAMTAMLTAAGETPVLVRVPWLEESAVMRALDAGAAGVICPMINSPAEAVRFVECVRYPPAGRRSFGPVRAQLCFGDDYYARANDEVVALAMVETREGVACVDDILAVPGLDGVYVGPADLACSLGYAPSFAPRDREVVAAIDAVAVAARRREGAVAGLHANDAETARAARRRGFNFVTAATDARVLRAGMAAVVDQLKRREDDENDTVDDGAGVGGVSDGAVY